MYHILAVLLKIHGWMIFKDIYQGQRSLHATHLLMSVIIHAHYRKNPSRTLCAVEQTQDVTYFSSFITKSWLNDLEDTGQNQRSTHPLMPVISFVPNMESIHPELHVLQSGHDMRGGRADRRTDPIYLLTHTHSHTHTHARTHTDIFHRRSL